MKLYLDCIPCFQKQALFTTREQNDQIRSNVLKKIMLFLCSIDWNISHDEIVNKVYNIIREETKNMDPYKDIKKKSNEMVLELYPKLKNQLMMINDKEKRLYISAKLAIAGNIIDFGPAFDFDLDKTIKDVLNKKPAIDDFKILAEKILLGEKLLYFADNAGEIVLDKIFIEEMIKVREKPFKLISFVVKGGPIINDAMIDDAYDSGIDTLPNVTFYKLGNGVRDTGPNRVDDIVKEWIRQHDVVISKGQGNFEGLSENSGVFFMLIAKCPIIAGELGVEVMDTVIKYQK
ncbi:ARMT1-like domain-containing protein [Thermoanaerobacterium sp. RBIITD]|uniref:damage-control phosphatase ARMT1 family protein n=1 Tax=Thermoanaerobacterium sp. RBIITD TaxID=1550240 RepID=UPI000BB6F552|nr:ARMT1-like domain-containing protein [Thermoanaerobacterium sp. RBIITD]SNX55216.1 hypothetical protein SAMN05660242_3027 [Thermoanaerobacterium sp. RBIITD]